MRNHHQRYASGLSIDHEGGEAVVLHISSKLLNRVLKIKYSQQNNNDSGNGLASKASHRINGSLANLKTLHRITTTSTCINNPNMRTENVVESHVCCADKYFGNYGATTK